jgi:predicted CoA-binding protein
MPSIAVIGASSDRSKFGNKCVRAYLQKGWDVYPVHPKEAAVEGRPVSKSILDVPIEPIDRVSIYLPPAVGIKVLDEIAKKKVGEVWFNPGADAPEVLARARELGLKVVAACAIVAIGLSPYELN